MTRGRDLGRTNPTLRVPTLRSSVLYKNDDFTQLAIRQLPRGEWVRLIALKATANFYGWAEVFPTWNQARALTNDGTTRRPAYTIRPRRYRGVRHFICRDLNTTQGFPARLTNCFRVTNNATAQDLVAIAQATQIDYGWMTAKYGERRKKACWDAIELPDSYCHFDLRAAESEA